ncbi:K(+) efflux antiporter [Arachis hypogaea]|nr:K(+) efflux antiporter [Arachis hypogaea]
MRLLLSLSHELSRPCSYFRSSLRRRSRTASSLLARVPDAESFNNSVAKQQVVLETVARVKPKKNETKDEKLISDLVVAIVLATCGGVAFAFVGQPA